MRTDTSYAEWNEMIKARIKLREELANKLNAASNLEGISRNELVNQILLDWVEDHVIEEGDRITLINIEPPSARGRSEES